MNLLSISRSFFTQQWPFWLGGFFVGFSEILFYVRYDKFIGVTTGFAQLYAVSEKYVFHIDWVGRVYEPGVQWVILGAIAGARLVAVLENESRAWVQYHWRMLALAFIGGIFFSFGTRLAAGCTTHHFIGGLASMSIASWIVLLTGVPFAFLAFQMATWMGMGGYFRHQETRAIASLYCHDSEHPQPGYNPAYQPRQDLFRWLMNIFFFMFLGTPLYFAFFTSEIEGGISEMGWNPIAWMVLCGGLLGIGIAKCGFGTECAVMAPESIFTKPEFYRARGVPLSTYRLFRGMLPFQGFMMAIVIFNLFILFSWLTGHGAIPNASRKYGLYWGHFLGGPLLAMGAVFMIGCEVRTYARLGLGYGTALAALPGFYVGYLPYTLFQDQIDAVAFSQGLTKYITLPQWMAATLGGSEALWSIVYSLFLVSLLVFSFEGGRRFFRISLSRLLRSNTDELVYHSST
ncbi:Sulf_transp domain-containing protein [Gammaproteobacteria bacterium]